MNKTLVINLFGTPSAGKSTGAAYIFAKLKMAGINAELITEFAKDKVWEENREVFKPDNQLYIFAKQFFRMNRCSDKVDVIVTDSPLPLSAFYNKSEVLGDNFNNVVINCFNSFNNISYLVIRNKPYNPKGRLQTEEESDAMKQPLIDLLDNYNINYKVGFGNTEFYDQIVEEIIRRINYDV